jgi:hypothetical protein
VAECNLSTMYSQHVVLDVLSSWLVSISWRGVIGERKMFFARFLTVFFARISLGSGGFNQPGFEQERYFKHSIVLGEQKKQFVVSVAIC